jgi:hypothetical protein
VVLLGAVDGPVRTMVEETLERGRVPCALVRPDHGRADVVLVVVRWGEVPTVVAAARSIADRAPVVAILPMTDARLAHEVLQHGANAWWPLDAPPDLLRSMVVVFAGGGPPVGARDN